MKCGDSSVVERSIAARMVISSILVHRYFLFLCFCLTVFVFVCLYIRLALNELVYKCVNVPERSKGVDSSSTVFALVGSNPTVDIYLFFELCFIYLFLSKK